MYVRLLKCKKKKKKSLGVDMHTVNSIHLLLQSLCGSNMEDRHNKKHKHVALYICQKHIWLYVTGSLLFKTVPSLRVCEIKAERCIGSNS